MSIVRTRKRENPYLMMDKTGLNDERLSFKAKGLLAYLLSKPDNWTAKISHLQTIDPDGEHSVQTALQELEEVGYLERKEKRNDKGQFQGTESIIYESPQKKIKQEVAPERENPDTDNPDPDNPDRDFPDRENQGLINKDINNNVDNNKRSSNNNKRASTREENNQSKNNPTGKKSGSKQDEECIWTKLEEPLIMITRGNTMQMAHFQQLKAKVENDGWEIDAIIKAIEDTQDADRPSFKYLKNRLAMVEEYAVEENIDNITADVYDDWLDHKKQKAKEKWQKKKEEQEPTARGTANNVTNYKEDLFKYDPISDAIEQKLQKVHKKVFGCELSEEEFAAIDDLKFENNMSWEAIVYLYKLIYEEKLDMNYNNNIVKNLKLYKDNLVTKATAKNLAG